MVKVLFFECCCRHVKLSILGQARDYISVVGSSTVLPFATIVAEQMGNNPSYKTPVVESGGSSFGKKALRRDWCGIY